MLEGRVRGIVSPLRSLIKIFLLSIAAGSQDEAVEAVDEDRDLILLFVAGVMKVVKTISEIGRCCSRYWRGSQMERFEDDERCWQLDKWQKVFLKWRYIYE